MVVNSVFPAWPLRPFSGWVPAGQHCRAREETPEVVMRRKLAEYRDRRDSSLRVPRILLRANVGLTGPQYRIRKHSMFIVGCSALTAPGNEASEITDKVRRYRDKKDCAGAAEYWKGVFANVDVLPPANAQGRMPYDLHRRVSFMALLNPRTMTHNRTKNQKIFLAVVNRTNHHNPMEQGTSPAEGSARNAGGELGGLGGSRGSSGKSKVEGEDNTLENDKGGGALQEQSGEGELM